MCTKNATEWARGLGAAVSKASATQSSWPRRPSGPVWSTPGPTHIPAKSVKPVSHDQHPQGTLILRPPPPNSPPRHPRTWTPLFLTPPSPAFDIVPQDSPGLQAPQFTPLTCPLRTAKPTSTVCSCLKSSYQNAPTSSPESFRWCSSPLVHPCHLSPIPNACKHMAPHPPESTWRKHPWFRAPQIYLLVGFPFLII